MLRVSDKAFRKIVDLETKKSVHISMTKLTHSQFRKCLLDYNLSMQEVLELFAQLVGENDDRAIDIIKQAKDNKRQKTLKKLTNNEVESLYDAISQIDPFS